MNLINKDEKILLWRFASKITNTVYANISVVTPEMNILQQQRFIFNVKRFVEKNDKVILKYLDEEYL